VRCAAIERSEPERDVCTTCGARVHGVYQCATCLDEEHPRDLAEKLPGDFSDSGWIDEQRHQRALMEIRMRSGQLKPPPTIFSELDSRWSDL